MELTTEAAPDIRRWLPAAYFMGFILFVAPVLETFGALWPPRLGEAAWRYGAVGIFLSFAGSAALGLLCALLAARELGHRVVLRIVGILAIVVTLAILTACSAFVLDVLQVRPMVNPALKGGFELAAAKSLLTGMVVMIACILIAMTGFRASAPASPRRSRRRDGGADLLVREPDSLLE